MFSASDAVQRFLTLCRETASPETPLFLTGHDNPDFDSAAGCFLAQKLLSEFGISAEIRFPTPVDDYSRKILCKLGFDPAPLEGPLPEQAHLILIDHHEPFYSRPVLACIDHHPTIQQYPYPFYCNPPASSCTKTIFCMAEAAGLTLSERWNRLAVWSVYMDTQATRSSKFNPDDRPWLEQKIRQYRLPEQEMSRDGFCCMDLDEPLEVLALNSLKYFRLFGYRVASSSFTAEQVPDQLIQRILVFLRQKMQEQDVFLWVFLQSRPEIPQTLEVRLFPDHQENILHPRLISRSKDVMPVIEQLLKERSSRKDLS